jgi:hypothetical protein
LRDTQRYHQIRALFRGGEDTLHVSVGAATACYEYAATSGMTYRCAPAGNRPAGVRISGFLVHWGQRRAQAYAEIARFLRVDADDVHAIVEAQIARRHAKNRDARARPRPARQDSLPKDARDRY